MKLEIFLKYLWLWLTLLVFGLWLLAFFWITTENVEPIIITQVTPKEIKPSSDSWSFMAGGDVMLSRVVAQKIDKLGSDFPFAKISDLLKSTNFNFANLETPLVKGPVVPTGLLVFRADPELATTLAEYNFKVLSLANNHLPNYEQVGIESTLDSLEQVSILGVGAGTEKEAYAPQYLDVQGKKIAFIAQNSASVVPMSYKAATNHLGTALIDLNKLKTSIALAKAKAADLVIVSLHAGNEYQNQPNQEQVNFAHTAIEAGADLVIGHHPHVVQTVEEYQGKYIFYSLGNLIFDQMWSKETKQGLMVKFSWQENKLQKIILYPVIIENYGQPRLASQKEGEVIIKRLSLPLSDIFQTVYTDTLN